MISVTDLRKTYSSGDDDVVAVADATFEIERGEVVGLLGPNGAGKTTLIKSVLGLVTPTAGSISVDGVDPHDSPQEVYADVSAVLEGARNLYWRLSVRENLRFFAGIHGRHPNGVEDEIDRLLSMLGLADRKHEHVRNLSRGMKQKASIACALIRDAPVLFLDEPTLGLDVQTTADLRAELKRLPAEEGKTLVVSSHDMRVIQDVCDRVIILNEGRIVANDAIENLVDLFSTRAYDISVDEGTDVDAIDSRFDCEVTERADGEVFVTVVIGRSESVYDVMDALRAADASIRRIESKGTDLETAFLNAIGADDAAEGTAESKITAE